MAFDHLVIKIRLFFTSNLLQPSGVMLRPAVFSLKVYRAEDIPQSENMFFILSHGPCPFSVSCLKATNIYLLLSFLCRFFKRLMQFTVTRYDRARDKTGLKYYVCFFALLVDSGFFEGVKKVLHVGEVGFFRYFCVNDLMPSCPLFSVKFLFCFHWCSISTSVTSIFIFFFVISFFLRNKKN